MPRFLTGESVGTNYEIERYLGEGAFAEVYRVRHRFLGRQAMKVFKRTGMTPTEVEKILGEAVLLSRIGHPNIVRVFDANVLDSPQGLSGYFTMEYIPSGSLDRFWNSYGTELVPVETTVGILRQLCRGMSVAHGENPPIVHRDIKPQNILIGYEADGLRARLSDFGLAKAVNPLTLLASTAGTITFKPPEAFSRFKADSCAADIWALGVTLYLLLTDSLPYKVEPDRGRSNRKAFAKEPIRPSILNSAVDESLDSIVLQCLKANPADRYRDASDLLRALESWQGPNKVTQSTSTEKTAYESEKSALGERFVLNHQEGVMLAEEATRIARISGRLLEGADMMEEAFNKCPSLRQEYADRVRLWRCGICM